MENDKKNISVVRLTENGKGERNDFVAREFPLTIILNNQELVTLLCTPSNLNYLALGFLSSEGLIQNKDEVKKVMVDEKRGVVRVETKANKEFDQELVFKRFITSGCGRGASFYSAADVREGSMITSQTKISGSEVLSLMKDFLQHSQIYRETGGVHGAALCDNMNILIFADDIGRHNAIDKIFGRCLLESMATDNYLIITSGRISSEVLLKVAKRNIPIIISKSAPTDLGVKLAADLGITLIGFVRGKRMNIYANDWRVINSKP